MSDFAEKWKGYEERIMKSPVFKGWKIGTYSNRLGFLVTGPYVREDTREIGPCVFIPYAEDEERFGQNIKNAETTATDLIESAKKVTSLTVPANEQAMLQMQRRQASGRPVGGGEAGMGFGAVR